MQNIEVTITLDPIKDGAVIKEKEFRRKNEGALIIATNGESRIVGIDEAEDIIERLSKIGHGEFIGNMDYIAMINGDKILNIGTGKCFIGSALVMKCDDRKLSMLVEDEFEEAAKAFLSRLITIVGDGQEFTAFEIL